MFALKSLSHGSVLAAIAKAEHYRLLGEPAEAESICRDVLAIEPGNQYATVLFVLAQSDRIGVDSRAFAGALAAASELTDEYQRAYYSGIVWERRAKAMHEDRGLGTNHTVYEWVVKALRLFEQAEQLRAEGNDDAVLRWNTCVRFLQSHANLTPRIEEAPEPIVSE
ncbi:MAG: hypothetical protein ABJC09_07645 [Terriglobia bacterium]